MQTPDLATRADRLRRLPQHTDKMLRALFERQSAIYVARAPGRLDVMGGIGDYSGSLVLELPLAEAAFAAVQPSRDGGVTIASLHEPAGTQQRITTITPREWSDLRTGTPEAAYPFFARERRQAWAACVAGPVLVLLRETKSEFAGGLRILIDSDVPEGKGVSSSAAVEVATMRAAAAVLGIELAGEELARLCQLAENQVVGAPCGIMDQITSALGRENQLLALRCQPATVEGFVPIPPGVALWGIDSGIRHAVSGSEYSAVRCGAFMGYRMIAEAAGGIEAAQALWHGYLANIGPDEFHNRFGSMVPEQMSGREFLDRYGDTTDHATRVDPGRTYPVRAATLHPIEENQRAARYRALLQGPNSDEALRELGQLMYAAHASYSACGLASDGTDLVVDLVRETGHQTGLFGAKITGGGSGGTVAILGRADAADAVESIAQRYAELTKRKTRVFRGSSAGAYSMPVEEIVI
jgi:L-arabinokinase